MTVISWEDFISRKASFPETVNLTVGVFDGVHVGHRRLLKALGNDAEVLVITFRNNPEAVLSRGETPEQIMTFRQRAERLEAFGVRRLVAIDFSEQFSRLSGKDFVRLLEESLRIGKIAVGYDSRFGKDRDMDARALQAAFADMRTRIETVEPVLYEGKVVSSSRIRTAIRDAEFGDVERMLGTAHTLDLRNVPRAEESRASGHQFIRMQKSDIHQCLPFPGRYPVSSEAEAARRHSSAWLTVGVDAVELELPGHGFEDAAVRNIMFRWDERKESKTCL